MIKPLICCFSLFAVALCGATNVVKNEVATIHKNLVAVQKEIDAKRQSVQVLQSDWAQLNSPAHLEVMVKDLVPALCDEPQKMVHLASLPGDVEILPDAVMVSSIDTAYTQ